MDLSSLATMEHMYHIQRNTFFWQHAGILVPSESESRSVVSNSLWPHWLHSPCNSPGQNTGMGSLSLLQGNLPNPGIKPWSCRQILYQLSHEGSPQFPDQGSNLEHWQWKHQVLTRRPPGIPQKALITRKLHPPFISKRVHKWTRKEAYPDEYFKILSNRGKSKHCLTSFD